MERREEWTRYFDERLDALDLDRLVATILGDARLLAELHARRAAPLGESA